MLTIACEFLDENGVPKVLAEECLTFGKTVTFGNKIRIEAQVSGAKMDWLHMPAQVKVTLVKDGTPVQAGLLMQVDQASLAFGRYSLVFKEPDMPDYGLVSYGSPFSSVPNFASEAEADAWMEKHAAAAQGAVHQATRPKG